MSKSAQVVGLIQDSGKYTIISEFDEGVNGYAFKARHAHLERDTFLKVIDADPQVNRTFAEPKALLEAVEGEQCENLVRLYDAEPLGQDYVLMSMEFIEGGSLNGQIVGRTLGQMDAVQLTLGVLTGLAQLHKAGFLHRDVKPGNLLFKNTGLTKLLKLGDFGSVRRLENDSARVPASRHSALYRPPEAWGDNGWFTFSSDLYQLGVCLYEMVNGPMPYTFEAHLDAQAQKNLKALDKTIWQLDAFTRSQIADGCLERRIKTNKLLEMTPPAHYLSRRLATLIRKATAIDHEERFQSAFEFHSALQSFSAPNWKISGESYFANAWKGWDWQVAPVQVKSALLWASHRARSNSGNFRAYGAKQATAKAACKAVEDFS